MGRKPEPEPAVNIFLYKAKPSILCLRFNNRAMKLLGTLEVVITSGYDFLNVRACNIDDYTTHMIQEDGETKIATDLDRNLVGKHWLVTDDGDNYFIDLWDDE